MNFDKQILSSAVLKLWKSYQSITKLLSSGWLIHHPSLHVGGVFPEADLAVHLSKEDISVKLSFAHSWLGHTFYRKTSQTFWNLEFCVWSCMTFAFVYNLHEPVQIQHITLKHWKFRIYQERLIFVKTSMMLYWPWALTQRPGVSGKYFKFQNTFL